MFVLTGTVLTASYRGRPLDGYKLRLPEGYVGKLSFLAEVKLTSQPYISTLQDMKSDIMLL